MAARAEEGFIHVNSEWNKRQSKKEGRMQVYTKRTSDQLQSEVTRDYYSGREGGLTWGPVPALPLTGVTTSKFLLSFFICKMGVVMLS